MDNIKQAWGKVQGGWQALDKSKKIQLGVILTAIILVVGGLTYITKKVDYSVLFSEMEASDAGLIVDDLEAQGVAYKLEDNGTTILIDSSLVDKYRIELAMNDMVPENSIGFEIFDTSSMMATDEDRNIMYQRAVSGELERAISTLDTVKSAKVILSMPEDSVFVDQENRAEASASVVITPRKANISPAEVQGIASLMAGAVDNLPQENIKIVDNNGNLLSSALGDESVNSATLKNQYRDIEASYEKDMEQKLIETLGPIYGMNNLTVSVSVAMNFDAVEEEAVDYDPNYITEEETEGPVVRSESVQANGSNMTTEETGGNDNISNVIVEGEAEDGSSYNRTVNNEIDTKTTRTIKAPGTVTSFSTSIVFNGNLNLDQTEQIREIAQMTIGVDPGSIAIQGIPFATDDADEDAPIIGADFQEELIKAFKNNWPYAAGGIGLIILLTLMMRILKKRRAADDEFDDLYDEVEEEPIQSVVKDDIQAALARKAAQQAAEKEEADLKLQLNKTMSEKENKVKTMAEENPEMAADLIKIWMKEE